MDIIKEFRYCTGEIDQDDYTLHKANYRYAWCDFYIELEGDTNGMRDWVESFATYAHICQTCLSSCSKKEINELKYYFIVKRLKD